MVAPDSNLPLRPTNPLFVAASEAKPVVSLCPSQYLFAPLPDRR
jgi:hypothetical protein